jgi:hypothetical protein
MNSLIIVGNGFDLAHGIQSSYRNFCEWLCMNGKHRFVDMMDTFFSIRQDVWSNIEQALGDYDEEKVLDYCRPDEEFDLEHSLSSSARVEDSPSVFFQPVLDTFREEYRNWVDEIDISCAQKIYRLDPSDYYLTFNYTDTLETVYKIPEEHVAHIHGSRLLHDEYVVGHNNLREPSILFGDDGLPFEQQAKENIITWMNELKKNYAGNIAKHHDFFNGLVSISQVITYGHSMAQVDWPYFKEIIEIVGAKIPWNISCFSKEDKANVKVFQTKFNLANVKAVKTIRKRPKQGIARITP